MNGEIKYLKLSRKKFAEKVNIPYNTFKSWHYYERSVEVGTAHVIAEALGVSLEYLITGYDRTGEEKRMNRISVKKDTMAKIKKFVGKIDKELVNL